MSDLTFVMITQPCYCVLFLFFSFLFIFFHTAASAHIDGIDLGTRVRIIFAKKEEKERKKKVSLDLFLVSCRKANRLYKYLHEETHTVFCVRKINHII